MVFSFYCVVRLCPKDCYHHEGCASPTRTVNFTFGCARDSAGFKMLFVGQWDSNSYPYIGEHENQFYVGWVYADANGGAAEAPLWVSKENGYAITGDFEGEKEFAYPLFPTIEDAKASLPNEEWQTQKH